MSVYKEKSAHYKLLLQKRGKAQQLMDKVFEHLELVEKDYFGLQYMDLSPGDDTLVLQAN